MKHKRIYTASFTDSDHALLGALVSSLMKRSADEIRIIDDRGGSNTWVVGVYAASLWDLPQHDGVDWIADNDCAVRLFSGWEAE